MKRLSFYSLLLLFTVFSACNDKTETATETANDATMNNDQSKQKEMLEANRQVQRAIETGDSVLLMKYMADDAVDHGGGPNGEDLKGKEIVSMLTSVHRDIDNLKFEVIQEAANEDHVFCLVRMSGTTNKPVWGMPANHKMDSRSVDVIKMKDGKMTDHWGFYDMAEMMQMMQAGKPAEKK